MALTDIRKQEISNTYEWYAQFHYFGGDKGLWREKKAQREAWEKTLSPEEMEFYTSEMHRISGEKSKQIDKELAERQKVRLKSFGMKAGAFALGGYYAPTLLGAKTSVAGEAVIGEGIQASAYTYPSSAGVGSKLLTGAKYAGYAGMGLGGYSMLGGTPSLPSMPSTMPAEQQFGVSVPIKMTTGEVTKRPKKGTGKSYRETILTGDLVPTNTGKKTLLG